MKFSKRKTCLAVALAVSALGSAIPAMAAAITGGGSSLVGPSINSEIALFGANPDSLTYYITSSGTGQTAFLKDDASVFSSTARGPVDFANSDAAIASTYLSSYNSLDRAADGPLIQIPYIVTPITIPYVNGPTSSTDTLNGPQTTPGQTHSLALNDADLCGIFSGKLTNWHQVTNPDTGAVYTLNKAIDVAYRSDKSGTTELLMRHLSTVCPTIPGSTVRADGTTVTFADSQAFTASFPNNTPPASFTGYSGSGGIKSALVAATSTSASAPSVIGYLSPDWTNRFLAPSSSSSSANLSVASLRNARLNVDVAPTYTEATHAVGASTTPVPSTRTAAADPTQWVPNSANPTTGYPISGTSQILLSQCYANANVKSTVLNFLTAHYQNANYAKILHNNGFATVPAAYETAISNDFLTNNSGYRLNIATGKTLGSCRPYVGR